MLRTLHETLPTDQYSLPAMAVAPNLRRHSGQTSMHTSMHTTTYCCPAARKQVQVVQNLIHVLHQIAVGEFAKAIHHNALSAGPSSKRCARHVTILSNGAFFQGDSPRCCGRSCPREETRGQETDRPQAIFLSGFTYCRGVVSLVKRLPPQKKHCKTTRHAYLSSLLCFCHVDDRYTSWRGTSLLL